MFTLYVYRAKVVRVVDGDTLIADVDLGFNTWSTGHRFRLSRIDAPEQKTVAGKTSTNFLTALLDKKEIVIKTIKDKLDKYGRYLVEVYIDDINVNDMLVEKGHAVSYKN